MFPDMTVQENLMLGGFVARRADDLPACADAGAGVGEPRRTERSGDRLLDRDHREAIER